MNTAQDPTHQTPVQIINKNLTAFWLLIVTQIVFCVMSMFLDDAQLRQEYSYLALQEFFYTGAMLILVVIGFGLISGSARRIAWSSVGFNLLIVAICTQLYFFMQIFWVKAQLQQYNRRFSTYEENTISFGPYDQKYGDMNEAIKCSLSIIVAFSFILGRAGILQVYFMSIFGTIVYELSHQVLLKVTDYEIGSAKIFLFGGSFGLFCSLMLRRKQVSTGNNPNILANTNSTTTVLLGLLMVWLLFPLLSRDQIFHTIVETNNLRMINIALSLAGSTVVGTGIAFTDFGFRGFVICSISGGIACLSSSPFITNPAYAISFGIAAAIIQIIILYIFYSPKFKTMPIIGSFSFVYFVQGLMGIFILTINKSIITYNSNKIQYDWQNKRSKPQMGILGGLIPAGMGLVLGILLGLLFSYLTYHRSADHFIDFTYWQNGNEKMEDKSSQKNSQNDIYIVENNKSGFKSKHSYL